MIKSEVCDSPQSSSGSDSSLDTKATGRACSRPSLGRHGGASTAASPDKAEADSARGRRGTGGGVGLSSQELQELHKNDPKRAKRILANRSSAARSKVRKLRYIAELESKSAALQDEAATLILELESLQDKALKLSKENDELFTQAYDLQDHTQVQELENQQLLQQANQLKAMQSHFPQLVPTLPQGQQQPVRSNLLDPSFPAAAGAQEMQEDQLPSLQFPRRAFGPQQYQQLPSFANLTSMFQNPTPQPSGFAEVLPDLSIDATAFTAPKTEMTLNNAALSGSSSISIPSQETRAKPEMDTGLLELLSLNPELETTPKPFVPPLMALLGRMHDESLPPLGLHGTGTLPSLDSSASHSDFIPGLRSLPHSQSMLMEAGRHRSMSSGGSSYSTFITSRLTAPPNPNLAGFQEMQGLRRWPRHFSDPQGFTSGFQPPGY